MNRTDAPFGASGAARENLICETGDGAVQSGDALAVYIEAAERVGGESYPPLGLALSS
ncbi:hypothetical protein [Streptomyces luteogriseus]|uniref:hypothetical protein n=1 Tax=Streptomyces luteogriseus TaxID=68233 RepID=UPI0037A53B4D